LPVPRSQDIIQLPTAATTAAAATLTGTLVFRNCTSQLLQLADNLLSAFRGGFHLKSPSWKLTPKRWCEEAFQGGTVQTKNIVFGRCQLDDRELFLPATATAAATTSTACAFIFAYGSAELFYFSNNFGFGGGLCSFHGVFLFVGFWFVSPQSLAECVRRCYNVFRSQLCFDVLSIKQRACQNRPLSTQLQQ